MKKLLVIVLTVLLGAPFSGASALEKGFRFKYGMKPGDKWVAEEVSQVQTEALMGQSFTLRERRTMKYEVSAGPKRGWVTITARIVSQTSQSGEEPANRDNPLEGMVFKAEMHSSGEVRKYSTSGGDERIAGYVGPSMKAAIFRFPEFPEEALRPGDDFDVTVKTETGGMQGIGSVQAAMKLTYTLEEVSAGLAHFSVVQRAQVKATGMEIKDAGKGSAVFDMKQGMWVEHEIRSKSLVESGMASGASVLQVSKVTLERADR